MEIETMQLLEEDMQSCKGLSDIILGKEGTTESLGAEHYRRDKGFRLDSEIGGGSDGHVYPNVLEELR